MDDFNKTVELIKKKNIRITKQRLAFLEVIYNNHFTFNEFYDKLKVKGYSNLATFYNNVDFFIDNGLLKKYYVNNADYYELLVNNDAHSLNSQIHFTCNKNNKLHEINTADLIDFLNQYPSFNGIKINNIELLATGECKGICDYNSTKVCKLETNE